MIKKLTFPLLIIALLFSCSKKKGAEADEDVNEQLTDATELYNISDTISFSDEDEAEIVKILSKIYSIDSLQDFMDSANKGLEDVALAQDNGQAAAPVIDPSKIELRPIKIELMDGVQPIDPQASKNWAVDTRVWLNAVDTKAINYNNRTIPDEFKDDYDRLRGILTRYNVPISDPVSGGEF
jgi:hypothetical protein